MIVIALAPAGIVGFLSLTQPGYFKPVLESPTGNLLIAGAFVLWLLGLLLARKILAVDT